MAIRNIVKVGDDILKKECKPVKEINDKIITLLDDMIETLHEANGAGLAAPQVGVLKQIAIVEVDDELYELINPEIIKAEGSQRGEEGCLSYPGKYGYVTRPNVVTVRAMDREGNVREITGTELLARAFCHEIDHLHGKMFMSLVDEWLDDDNN